MTPAGYARLEAELKELKTVERPAVIRQIAEAREHGDLSENAEYHAARERQSFIEGRVLELEDKLSRAEVIDIAQQNPNGRIMFGCLVKLVDEDTDEEVEYRIVGPDESNIEQGLLSVTSPVAKALIGKEVGDTVEVVAPGATRNLEVLDITYG